MSLPEYRNQLDALTDELLRKSTETMKRIDESIKLAHSLRLSNSLVSQMDLQISHQSNQLQKYQSYLSELNSLMIKSEYLEAQLITVETHQRLNKKRISQGLEKLNDWKDDDLSLRTIEATLENLFLEFRYLTKKVESKLDPSSDTLKQKQKFNHVIEKKYQIPINNNSINKLHELKLKPMRCFSSIEENPSTPISARSFNLLTHRKTSLLTPESSFNYSTDRPLNHSFDNQKVMDTSRISPDTSHDYIGLFQQDILENTTFEEDEDKDEAEEEVVVEAKKENKPNASQFNSKPKTHFRSSSLPKIIGKQLDIDQLISINGKSHKTTNLRHFLSHDTGLETKAFKERNSNKNSIQPIKINPIHKVEAPLFSSSPENTKETIIEDDCSIITKEDEINSEPLDDPVTELEVELPKFEHKLNRSNSCDSIFSTMKSRIAIAPKRDNKQQTLNWMKMINNNQRSNSLELNVTTLSVGSTPMSSISDPKKTMSTLAAYTKEPSSSNQRHPNNIIKTHKASNSTILESFQTFLKPSTPLTTTTEEIPNSKKSPDISSSPVAINNLTYHSFNREPTIDGNDKQWSTTLLNKLKPQKFISSQSLVISEIGRAIPISTNQRKVYNRNPEVAKGRFSTMTIGPNRSKFVQHGESSSLGKSLVLSSRISYAALRDALNDDTTR